jgi:thymidylate synthase ThyX
MENQAPEVESGPAAGPNSTEVYAVHGAEPEVQAYAMAKYSRSALSMKDSLREISTQKAEKFLNTFYFQYGHRSIADLAHIALAIERLSILAAIAAVDEQRWDGQERSTRYQDFRRSGYYVPDFGGDLEAEQAYRGEMDRLFADYQTLSAGMWRYLAEHTPRPAEMKQEAYERTLKARAFDLTRYLLPLGTNTSLGEIVNARTLEVQVSHLLSHTHAEVRSLAALMKQAATDPAYNVNHDAWRALVERVRANDPRLGNELAAELLKPVRVAPTLVKYADPNPYEIETRRELQQAAAETMRGSAVEHAAAVELLEDDPLEVELATTLLYEHCHYPYRQIRNEIEAAGASWRRQIIELGIRNRGKHDELLRAFAAGQRFRFDILMDIGGFRDMHRHRRCVQIGQDFTTAHGYDTPEEIEAAGEAGTYAAAMQRAADSALRLASGRHPEAGQTAQYVIPLGYRKRTLFKMDFAEVVYIAELRTTPAGHASYRRVAWAMFQEVARRYPALASCFRVHDVHEPVDLLKR